MQLQRYERNPIISPNSDNAWESLVTTNPGAWYDEDDGVVRLLYRVAGDDPQHVIRLAMATSSDGYHFERLDEPVFSPSVDGFDAGCVEDPRIIKMGKHYLITYAARPFAPGEYWLYEKARHKAPTLPNDFPYALRTNATSTGLLITEDFKSFVRAGRMTDPTIDDRDVILFPEKIDGKFFMLHRPMEWVGRKYGTEFPTIWIASGDDLLRMRDSKVLITARYDWETKLGGNTPPIRTEHGWLTIFHGVGTDHRYRLGALLLDLEDPSVVRYRTPTPILEPSADYELNGPYNGCVFPCGKVVLKDKLFVYYGAADKHVAVATCEMKELMSFLLANPV